MKKPGRNDPCYCGSGKKYKKCHLPIDQKQEKERRSWVMAANFLRQDLLEFAQDERFALPFAQALPHYWNHYYEVGNAEEMGPEEAERFFDWFLFDTVLEDGKRPLEIYHEEEREELSTVQQQVLDKWVAEVGAAWAYFLADYDAKTLTLRDVLTGEEFIVHEPGGRGVVEVDEVILTRLVPVHDHLEFSTTAAYLPHDEIGDLVEKLVQAKKADGEKHPDATHLEFMRRNNHLLIHHALQQAEAKNRPPVARINPERPDKAAKKTAANLKKFLQE